MSINTKIAHQNSKTASWDTWSLGMTRWEITGPEPHRAAQTPVQGPWEEKSWGLHPVAVVFQLLSRVRLFTTPWTAASRASLSFTISWSLLKLTSTESMPFNRLISPKRGRDPVTPLCHSPGMPVLSESWWDAGGNYALGRDSPCAPHPLLWSIRLRGTAA